MKLYKKILIIVILGISYISCKNQDNEPIVDTNSNNSKTGLVKFELNTDNYDISTNDNSTRMISFDAKNLILNEFPRIKDEQTYEMTTFFFREEGRINKVFAKTKLQWKAKKDALTGKIKMECIGEFPLSAVSFENGVYQEHNTIANIRKGEKIKIVGIMGGGEFDFGPIKYEYQGNNPNLGPRMYYDFQHYPNLLPIPQIQNSNGEIIQNSKSAMPYVLQSDITVYEDNHIKYLGQVNGKRLRIVPSTPMIKLVIENGTGESIPSDAKFDLRTKGVSTAFIMTFMSGANSPTPKKHTGVQDVNGNYGSTNVEWQSVRMPINISNLENGAIATYYIPVTLSNGDPQNIASIEIEFEKISPNYNIRMLEGSTKTEEYHLYRLQGTEYIKKFWFDEVQGSPVHTLKIYLSK